MRPDSTYSFGRNAKRHVMGVLVFCGCCNKLPKMWCLKTIEIYYLTVLEARNLKSVSQGPNQIVFRAELPQGLWERICSLPLSASRVAVLLGLWMYHSSLCYCGHSAFSSVFKSSSDSLL